LGHLITSSFELLALEEKTMTGEKKTKIEGEKDPLTYVIAMSAWTMV
jgi:hypothetical protein